LVSNWGQKAQDNNPKNQPGSVGFMRMTSYVVPYWTPENPINDYARLGSGLSGASFNVYRESSFIRLNTVSLAYNLPTMLINKVKMKAAKLYFNINNAAVYAPHWNLWDPQAQDNQDRFAPTTRSYSLGLNVSL
jgi:hypothetical protein